MVGPAPGASRHLPFTQTWLLSQIHTFRSKPLQKSHADSPDRPLPASRGRPVEWEVSHSAPLILALHPLTEGNSICLQAVVATIASHSASHLTEVLRIQWLSPESSMLGHLGTGVAGMM